MHAATSVSMATPLRAARDASRAPLRGASGSLKLASPLLGAPAVARSAAALRLGARRGAMVGARAAVMESAGRADIKLAADYLESKELSLPFADITLRAELDGATVRAHRGVLAMHSRVFAAALAEDSSKDECVLLRKSGADLRLLLGWLYRGEQFAKDNITAVCALAAELEMPQLLRNADEWLFTAANHGDLMDVPSLKMLAQDDAYVVQQYQQRLTSGQHQDADEEVFQMQDWLPDWLASKNSIVRDAAAVNFAHWSAVASSYPLPRFALAVASRTSAMDQADQLLLLRIQMRDMLAEVEALRPPVPGVLQLC